MTRHPERDLPMLWPGAALYECRTCEEVVAEQELLEHLGRHHPEGLQFTQDQARECFRYQGRRPEVTNGVWEAYQCPNGHVEWEPLD